MGEQAPPGAVRVVASGSPGPGARREDAGTAERIDRWPTFGVCQPREHLGFSVVGEHRTVAWCDLLTPDRAAAERFYAEVFGCTYQAIGTRHEAYALFTVPGMDRSAGGIGVPAEDVEHLHEVPPLRWTCFEVDDADTAAERVVTAGGTLVQAPEEFGYGELVFAAGPDGERFVMTGPFSRSGREARRSGR